MPGPRPGSTAEFVTMRRSLVLVLLLTGATACGRAPHRATVAQAGTTGAASADATPMIRVGGPDTTTSTPVSAVVSTPAATANTAPAGATPQSSAGARAALDAYLAGLAKLDQAAISHSAQGGPAVLGTVWGLAAQINSGGGGQTTITVGAPKFSPSDVTPTAVTFSGQVSITTEVAGPKGRGSAQDTISGPVHIESSGGAWKVTGFTYDSRPLVLYPDRARQVVDGIEFDVGSILTYGSSTTALVGLGAQNGHADLRLASTTLAAGGPAANGSGSFGTGPVVGGIMIFPRAAGAPTRLDATFQRTGGAPVSFSIALSAPPG